MKNSYNFCCKSSKLLRNLKRCDTFRLVRTSSHDLWIFYWYHFYPLFTALETCPKDHRGILGIALGLPYSIGVIVFAGIGYLLTSWRALYSASSMSALLLIPLAWWVNSRITKGSFWPQSNTFRLSYLFNIERISKILFFL